MDLATGLAWYVVFLFSTTLHEAAHAWGAKLGGDLTAYHGGQVSIDPIPHVRREPFGMLVLPLISLAVAGWPLGFASAPYDPNWARRHPRRSGGMALAGPLANLALVVTCAAAIWAGVALGLLDSPSTAHPAQIVVPREPGAALDALCFLTSILFTMNLLLFAFNLIPFPPLDGSGALALLVPESTAHRIQDLRAQPMLAFAGLFLAWKLFDPLFDVLFRAALGLLYPGSGWD
jgi:Zn-dependent protease